MGWALVGWAEMRQRCNGRGANGNTPIEGPTDGYSNASTSYSTYESIKESPIAPLEESITESIIDRPIQESIHLSSKLNPSMID